ncbi:hypothetical protein [Rubrobacter aplysinae]|uniref:hypothetical protein n=1 Tax=Rubrobacter aplysinae TaxID=909625 RepID=UPI00064B8BA3|nr:hypothetical protein [Rubrobacter aplysinae]
MRGRTRIFPEFLAVVAAGFILYGVMLALEGPLGRSSPLFSFETWLAKAPDNLLYRLLWLLGDVSEAEFYAGVFGGVGLLAFAFIAYRLDQAGSRWRGFPISYGTGLWPWVLAASSLGLIISVFLFGGFLSGGWVPTFVPFVSVPAGVVFIYGRGWKNVFTGGILGGLVTFPIAYLTIQYLLAPFGLPPVIGAVTGMWLGAIIVFELCRFLPWMTREDAPIEGDDIPETEAGASVQESSPLNVPGTRGWFGRRVLAEFSEAQLYGNELASAGLILGTLLTWALNPLHPALGSGLLPAIILSQVLTAAIGLLLYYGGWQSNEWYPTFVPVVSVAPAAVLTYGGSMQSIIAGAVLGAIAGPPVAQAIIKRLPDHWHLFIGNTFSMAICTLIIIPILGLLPGFEVVSA